MAKKIETIIIFTFLSLFCLATIYPVLNIVGVSLRTDDAFQSRSLSLIEFEEKYEDMNGNSKWDKGEKYEDVNNNNKWDSGSSMKSYLNLFTETDFKLFSSINPSHLPLLVKNKYLS